MSSEDVQWRAEVAQLFSLAEQSHSQLPVLRQLKKRRSQGPEALKRYQEERDKFIQRALKVMKQAIALGTDGVGTYPQLYALKVASEALQLDKKNREILAQRACIHLLRGAVDSFLLDIALVRDRNPLDVSMRSSFMKSSNFGDVLRALAIDGYWRVIDKPSTGVGLSTAGAPAPAPQWPPPRCEALSAVVGTSVFFFGGRDYNEEGAPFARSDMWRFDTDTLTWTELTPRRGRAPRMRAGGVLVHHDGYLYLYGGGDGSINFYGEFNVLLEKPFGAFADVWVAKVPAPGVREIAWTCLCAGKRDCPAGERRGCAALVRDGWLYVFSGFRPKGGSDSDMFRMRLSPKAPAHWEKVEMTGEVPCAREAMSHFVDAAGRWVVVGGEQQQPLEDTGLIRPDVFAFDFGTAVWSLTRPELLNMGKRQGGEYGAVPCARAQVGVAAADAGSKRLSGAFFGGWCANIDQPHVGPNHTVMMHAGSYYDILLVQTRDEPNVFKVVVPGPARPQDAPPRAAGTSCAVINDRVYVFFGHGTSSRVAPGVEGSLQTTPLLLRALDSVHVCTPADELHEAMGKCSVGPQSRAKAAEETGAAAVGSDMWQGYCVCEAANVTDYYEAFHLLIVKQLEVREAVSALWVAGVRGNGGKKGILLLELRIPDGERFPEYPPISQVVKHLRFRALEQLYEAYPNARDDPTFTDPDCVADPQHRFHVVFALPSGELQTHACKFSLAPGYGAILPQARMLATNLFDATPERHKELEAIVARDLFLTQRTRLRICMGGGGCVAVEGMQTAAGSDDKVKLSTCTGCKRAWYCSKACQTRHWRNGHKAECAALKARSASASGSK